MQQVFNLQDLHKKLEGITIKGKDTIYAELFVRDKKHFTPEDIISELDRIDHISTCDADADIDIHTLDIPETRMLEHYLAINIANTRTEDELYNFYLNYIQDRIYDSEMYSYPLVAFYNEMRVLNDKNKA